MSSTALLEIADLHVDLGGTPVIEGIDLSVDAGEMLGIVGESGCGKSVTALAVMRLLAPEMRMRGSVRLAGRELTGLSETEMQGLRGRDAAMIFQEPMTSLNPVFTVGDQVAETVLLHEEVSHRAALDRAAAMLDEVGLPAPREALGRYPHQMSGGQRQRVVIAMALICNPKLLIADEPTTALDVTVQAQILELLDRLRRDRGMAVLLITHDLGVVSQYCDRVAVMYGGRIVETATAGDLFAHPAHRYTGALLATIPAANPPGVELPAIPGTVPPLGTAAFGVQLSSALRRHGRCLRRSGAGTGRRRPSHRLLEPRGMSLLQITGLSKTYPGPQGRVVQAVSEVSLTVEAGEVLGVVGESGCGKSTLGQAALRLIEPTAGEIRFDGQDLRKLSRAGMRRARQDLQIIFQDPFGALNPRHRVGRIVGEPLLVQHRMGRAARRARVAELLEMVGLDADAAGRWPHEFSGGQRQRIAIARALALEPKLIVADEAVSALDVSVQSQIINLIAALRRRLGLSLIFISHDLSVIRHVSDRVAVMYLGRIVETGPVEALMAAPLHPYTQALLAAIPRPGAARPRVAAPGEVPDPSAPPPGCAFHGRCPQAMEICRQVRPALLHPAQRRGTGGRMSPAPGMTLTGPARPWPERQGSAGRLPVSPPSLLLKYPTGVRGCETPAPAFAKGTAPTMGSRP